MPTGRLPPPLRVAMAPSFLPGLLLLLLPLLRHVLPHRLLLLLRLPLLVLLLRPCRPQQPPR